MSIVQFFRSLWARRMLIGVSTLVCLVAAGLVAIFLPQRYEATSRVMMDVVKPDPVTGEVIASQWARTYVRTQLELIRDYRVAGQVADAAGWTTSPEMRAEYDASGAQDVDFRRWLANRVIAQTNARMAEGSNIIEITVDSAEPETASMLADLVRDAYVDQTLEFRRESARRNAQWFAEQTSEAREELAAAEQRMNDFEREHGVILTADGVDTDTTRLQALAGSAAAGSAPIMGGMAAPSAGQLAQLDAAIQAAGNTLGPNHPQLQQMQRQRAALAQTVAQERAAQSIGPGGPSLESLFNEQQARVLRNAGAADEARRLATDVAVLRDQYRNTAARTAQLEQQAQSTESGLTLLGDAVVPQAPASPNIPLILIGAVIGGLGFGVVAAMALELFWRRVRGVEELRLINVPVLGAMGETAENNQETRNSWRRLRFQPRLAGS